MNVVLRLRFAVVCDGSRSASTFCAPLSVAGVLVFLQVTVLALCFLILLLFLDANGHRL